MCLTFLRPLFLSLFFPVWQNHLLKFFLVGLLNALAMEGLHPSLGRQTERGHIGKLLALTKARQRRGQGHQNVPDPI